MKVMLPKLEAAGVKIYRNCQVVDLLTEQGAVAGMTVREQGTLRQVYAPVVVAAWGRAPAICWASLPIPETFRGIPWEWRKRPALRWLTWSLWSLSPW